MSQEDTFTSTDGRDVVTEPHAPFTALLAHRSHDEHCSPNQRSNERLLHGVHTARRIPQEPHLIELCSPQRLLTLQSSSLTYVHGVRLRSAFTVAQVA